MDDAAKEELAEDSAAAPNSASPSRPMRKGRRESVVGRYQDAYFDETDDEPNTQIREEERASIESERRTRDGLSVLPFMPREGYETSDVAGLATYMVVKRSAIITGLYTKSGLPLHELDAEGVIPEGTVPLKSLSEGGGLPINEYTQLTYVET